MQPWAARPGQVKDMTDRQRADRIEDLVRAAVELARAHRAIWRLSISGDQQAALLHRQRWVKALADVLTAAEELDEGRP